MTKHIVECLRRPGTCPYIFHNWWWDCGHGVTEGRSSLFWEAIDSLWPTERAGSFEGPAKEVRLPIGVDNEDSYCIVEALIAQKLGISLEKAYKPKKLRFSKDILL